MAYTINHDDADWAEAENAAGHFRTHVASPE